MNKNNNQHIFLKIRNSYSDFFYVVRSNNAE